MANYIVKFGESLWDVVLNISGSLTNLDAVLEANGFTDWVPVIIAGQSIIIPDTIFIDSNNVRELANYPSCNNSVADINAKIISIFASIDYGWILSTGYWNDSQIFKDSKNWID